MENGEHVESRVRSFVGILDPAVCIEVSVHFLMALAIT